MLLMRYGVPVSIVEDVLIKTPRTSMREETFTNTLRKMIIAGATADRVSLGELVNYGGLLTLDVVVLTYNKDKSRSKTQ